MVGESLAASCAAGVGGFAETAAPRACEAPSAITFEATRNAGAVSAFSRGIPFLDIGTDVGLARAVGWAGAVGHESVRLIAETAGIGSVRFTVKLN